MRGTGSQSCLFLIPLPSLSESHTVSQALASLFPPSETLWEAAASLLRVPLARRCQGPGLCLPHGVDTAPTPHRTLRVYLRTTMSPSWQAPDPVPWLSFWPVWSALGVCPLGLPELLCINDPLWRVEFFALFLSPVFLYISSRDRQTPKIPKATWK